MITRTLFFGSPGKLSVSLGQLVYDGEGAVHRTFPIEDIGFVIIESPQIILTAYALQALAEDNVAVVICDSAHLPSAQFLPYAIHTTTQESIAAQIDATEAFKDRIWKHIVRAKIGNQAALLARLDKPEAAKLKNMAEKVRNGDPENLEAQAARLYFHALAPAADFTRERFGGMPNAALNYGYALLRAAVARALIGSGLTCYCGIHHHNRYNAFCLADDVMEPYRPFVDQYIFGGEPPFDRPAPELTKEMKASLLTVLTCDVTIGQMERPLMNALPCTTASLVRCFLKEADRPILPELTP